jgi:hypothetical protein
MVSELKNRYTIHGNRVHIYLDSRDGAEYVAVISKRDLEKADSFPSKWYRHHSTKSRTWYVIGNYRDEYGNKKQHKLHRFLLGVTDPKIEVDHRNHQGLINTRENLRIVSHHENMLNRQKPLPYKRMQRCFMEAEMACI